MPDRQFPEVVSRKPILIVDDNATNRKILHLHLESWGFPYEEAASAAEAMEKLVAAKDRNEPFEVAIVDMQMPDTSGESLGRAIRQDEDLKSTKLIMLTSVGNRGDAARLEEAGFEAYLTKPIKQSNLYDCIAMVLGGASGLPPRERHHIITRHTLADTRATDVAILLAEDNPMNQEVARRILEKLG